jgi:hypothetical protein
LEDSEVVADLKTEDFASAFARLSNLASSQVEARRHRLESLENPSEDPYVSSPCLFCLDTFGKLPWRGKFSNEIESRALPVLQSR